MADNIVNARIQLKNDTEEHWNQATNFIPRQGEIIIYNADMNYSYPRIKIGNGSTSIINLPFIQNEINNNIYFAKGGTSTFPGVGATDIYYLDILTGSVYRWENNSYVLKYGLIKQSLQDFFNFNTGTMTNLRVDSNSATLIVNNGTEPSLTISNINIVTDKGSLEG